jgi:hypothetical protein
MITETVSGSLGPRGGTRLEGPQPFSKALDNKGTVVASKRTAAACGAAQRGNSGAFGVTWCQRRSMQVVRVSFVPQLRSAPCSRRSGRPSNEASLASKFTPEVCETILTALRDNPSVPSAASKAGIAAVTLNKWLHEGSEGVEKYQAFALEAQECRRMMKDSIVAALKETALDSLHPQQVRAAGLLLQNLYPTEFASVKHTVSHKAEDPEIDLSSLSISEKRLFHQQLKRIVSGDDDDTAAALTIIDANAPKAEA